LNSVLTAYKPLVIVPACILAGPQYSPVCLSDDDQSAQVLPQWDGGHSWLQLAQRGGGVSPTTQEQHLVRRECA